jgi:hypothetical protein
MKKLIPVQMNLRKRTIKNIDKICWMLEIENKVLAVDTAIRFYKRVVKHIKGGGDVVFEYTDGSRERLVIDGERL